MEITERHVGDVMVVAVAGRMRDMTPEANEFHERAMELTVAAAARGSPLVFDLSAVDYMSSMSLRTLMHVAKHAKAAGTKVAVAALLHITREVFEIAKFDRVIPVYPTVAEAIAALAGPAATHTTDKGPNR